MSTGIFDLGGWVQVDCTVADAFYLALGLDMEGRSGRGCGWGPLAIGGTLTDVSGEFGEPLTYTELVWSKNGYAVLREYRWPEDPNRKCEHWVPGPGFDQKAFLGIEDEEDA